MAFPHVQIKTALIILALMVGSTSAAPQAKKRGQLLKELKKCVHPDRTACDETVIQQVAELYRKGDVGVLPALMDVAPNSDGASVEALGEFFSDLLCRQPETFLRAVAGRPKSEQAKLLMLAAAADGGGMGCQNINSLRRTLKATAQDMKNPLASLARRCLVQVNKNNPQR